MKKLFLGLLLAVVAWAAPAAARTLSVTFNPPLNAAGQVTRADGSTVAWSAITGWQVVNTSVPAPGDIGTVIATLPSPATAPASGATITLTTGQLTLQQLPSGTDQLSLRAIDNSTTPIPGTASPPQAVVVPVGQINAPANVQWIYNAN